MLFLIRQGPLEKSLQSSVALERQKNVDNRVGIIRGSVQVSESQKKTFLELNRTFLNISSSQLMDQAVKYIEDMQEDFDFRYKTLQSRGEQRKDG